MGRKVNFCWWEAGFTNKALELVSLIPMLNAEAQQGGVGRNKNNRILTKGKAPVFVSQTF